MKRLALVLLLSGCATPYEPPQPCDRITNAGMASDSVTVVSSGLCVGHWR